MCLGHISSHLNKEVSLHLHLQRGYKTCLKVPQLVKELVSVSRKAMTQTITLFMLSLKQKNEPAVFIISLPRHFNFVSTFLQSLLSLGSVQFSSVAQSCPTPCDPMSRSTPGLPVHHQLPEFTQTHVHRVGDAIQPSHPLSSPSPPAPHPSQHQGLFQCLWVVCFKDMLFFIWLFHVVRIIMTRCSITLGTQSIPDIIVSALHALSNLTFIAILSDKSYFPHITDEDKMKLSLKILFLQVSHSKITVQQRLAAIQKQQGSLGWPGLILWVSVERMSDFFKSVMHLGWNRGMTRSTYLLIPFECSKTIPCFLYPYFHSVLNKSFLLLLLSFTIHFL